MEVLIHHRKFFLNAVVLLALVSALAVVNFAYSAPKDPAPISEDVFKSVMQKRTDGKPSPYAAAMQHQLESTISLLSVLEKRIIQRGKLNTSELSMLSAKELEVESVKLDIRNHFARVRAQLESIGLENKEKLWNKKQDRIESWFDKVQGALQSIGESESKKKQLKRVKEAKKIIAKLSDQYTNKRPVIDANPAPTSPPFPEIKTKLNEEKAPGPEYLSSVPFKPIMYAMVDGVIISDVPPPVTPLEASSCNYDATDLAETIDIKITTEVIELAKQLKYSPAKIFEYVNEKIGFRPYYGSLKGSQGTLISGEGNAIDSASLLIALLRSSKIPARYVKGNVVFIDDDRLTNWLGVKSYTAAKEYIGRGIPVSLGTNSVGQEYLVFEHVWVEACVPYGNYRGTGVDKSGHRWIPLDASFKQYDYQDGLTINTQFDYPGYLSTRTDDLPLEIFDRIVEQEIKSINPNNSLQDIPYSGSLVPLKYDILPASLPYIVNNYVAWTIGGLSETAGLPDGLRYKYHLTFKDVNNSALGSTYTLDIPETSLNRITASFKPATDADQSLYDAWSGDLNNLPASIVNVLPVIKVDGVEKYVGTTAVSLGDSIKIIMKVTNDGLVSSNPSCPGDISGVDPDVTCRVKRIFNTKAGSYIALSPNVAQVSDRYLKERSAKLLDSVNNGSADLDETLGEFLHLTLSKYNKYDIDVHRSIGNKFGFKTLFSVGVGSTSSSVDIQPLFDLPFGIFPRGLLIDVTFPYIHMDSTTGSFDRQLDDRLWEARRLSIYAGSAYEHYIWQENAHIDAISTVRGLQYANETGVPVITLDSTNIANYDTLMDASMAKYKASITSLVTDGAFVTVPTSEISYALAGGLSSWDGAIYMGENRTTGDMSALINGAFNGGYADFDFDYIDYDDSDYDLFDYEDDDISDVTDSIEDDADTGGDIVLSNYDEYLDISQTNGLLEESVDKYNNSSKDADARQNLNKDLNYYDDLELEPKFGNQTTGYVESVTNFEVDPVNVVSGNLVYTENDISIKSRGQGIVFQRFYNSLKPIDGPLGYGWTHSFNHYLLFLDKDYNGVKDALDTDGTTSTVMWHDGTGALRNFSVAATASGVPVSTAIVTPAGFNLTAQRNADGTYTVREKNGLTYIYSNVAGDVGDRARLLSISDRNTNTLSMNYTGNNLTSVTDDLNRSLTFTYNVDNRITEIQDFAGRQYQYDYDANGDLIEFKNPLAIAGQQPASTYTYYPDLPLRHAMQSHALPNGNSMTYEYYSNRKVFRHFNNLGETATLTYNVFRGETIVINERGFSKKYFFDSSGNPLKVIDENGGLSEYTYADPNHPYKRTSVRDPLGYVSNYEYDIDGNLLKTTNPSGSTIEYSYFNQFSQAQKVKDANDNYSIYKFDGQGNRLETISFKKGIGSNIDPTAYTPIATDIIAWTISTYDAYGNPLTAKRVRDFNSRDGPSVAYDFNDVVNGVDGLNAVNQKRMGDKNGDGIIAADEFDTADLTYDSLGRPLQGSSSWYPTQTQYDALGRVSRRSDAYNHMRDISYDANNNVVGQKLELAGNLLDQSSAIYDQADRRSSSTNSGGFTSYYQYDAGGNVIKITNPDNYTIGFEYDGNNRVIKAFDAEGNAVTRTLDLTGKIRTQTDPNGNTTTYDYYGPDKEGRLYRQYDALGRYTEFDYDANGNVIRVTDNLGRTTLSEYDALNRPVRIVGPILTQLNIRQVTKYSYDNLGNRTQVLAGGTDASGTNPASDAVAVQMTTQYDDFGRVIKQTDPLNRIWTYQYDTYGNLLQSTDAKNQTTIFTYNYGGQLATRTDHDGNVTSYSYNELGQPTVVSSPNVTYTYAYDVAHRRVSTIDSRGNKQMDYDYSPGGLLNGKDDNEGNQTDYLYDPVGRLTGIWAPNGDLVTYVYDAGGRLSEKWLPNGVDTQYSYNGDNTLASILNTVDTAEISRHDYTYDAIGQRENLTETINNVTKNYTYLYDELNRLTEVQDSTTSTAIESYGYDIYNNRQSRTSAAGTEVYIHDAAQQLNEIRQDTNTGALIASFNYDANGNMDLKSENGITTALSHDVLDRVTQVSQSGKQTQTYSYDQGNRRLQKTVGTTETNYLYEGSNIVGEYGTDWTLANAIYTHGAGTDTPISRDTDGLAEYYHQDGTNSVVAMTDMVGNVSGSARYDAFGNTIEQTGSVPLYGYTGREPDETGLIYYRARYYDPRIGRFTQADPAGFIDGINRYTYAVNNPVNYRDPSGRSIITGNTAVGPYWGGGLRGTDVRGGVAPGTYPSLDNRDYFRLQSERREQAVQDYENSLSSANVHWLQVLFPAPTAYSVVEPLGGSAESQISIGKTFGALRVGAVSTVVGGQFAGAAIIASGPTVGTGLSVVGQGVRSTIFGTPKSREGTVLAMELFKQVFGTSPKTPGGVAELEPALHPRVPQKPPVTISEPINNPTGIPKFIP